MALWQVLLCCNPCSSSPTSYLLPPPPPHSLARAGLLPAMEARLGQLLAGGTSAAALAAAVAAQTSHNNAVLANTLAMCVGIAGQRTQEMAGEAANCKVRVMEQRLTNCATGAHSFDGGGTGACHCVHRPALDSTALIRCALTTHLLSSPCIFAIQAVAKGADLLKAIAAAFGEQPQHSIWSALCRQVRRDMAMLRELASARRQA